MWRKIRRTIFCCHGSHVDNYNHQPYHACFIEFCRFFFFLNGHKNSSSIWCLLRKSRMWTWIICSSKIPSNLPSWLEGSQKRLGRGYLNSLQHRERWTELSPGYDSAHRLASKHWKFATLQPPTSNHCIHQTCSVKRQESVASKVRGWRLCGRLIGDVRQQVSVVFLGGEFSVRNFFGDETYEPILTKMFWTQLSHYTS